VFAGTLQQSSDGATVFVGSWEKKVYVIDTNGGTQKWGSKRVVRWIHHSQLPVIAFIFIQL
jgi:outer membrane protein assembly factor BamB